MKKVDNGFTLIEVLVAMLCITMSTLLLVQIMSSILRFPIPSYMSEDRIAIEQLRYRLVQSKQIFIDQGRLYFSYRNEPFYLQFHNQRLVKSEGYEIFLQALQSAWFEKEGDCYYVHWKRKIAQKALLTCE